MKGRGLPFISVSRSDVIHSIMVFKIERYEKLNELIAGVNKLIAEVKIERYKEALKFLRIL